ncbi:lipoate--protein ligase [Ignatzschineria cameli]|uniref:lipoate--protein ligase n=1 Tax=Ignatzschineria cameli TaxID=2182793 RepID=A0A2U2ATX5_9GAMM|nr:lipoate--protein ligase [Ignatzschineria cameli]PWD87390.1 lipoate--protein ligase [Ignatzschineria cameli]PWD88117.1 lipoate--protein ligase [Ignatzschineria cameli]PWD91147.1 lipoate--protein ligase [Ignatzschineria cameli]PWD92788.1 lipoate--protein ligase [Ignatzschineria cameli]PWD93809.1 lipoate--protein ligase [Ignatzschineria cameli]
MKPRLLISESVNPLFNLAVEDAIFQTMDASQQVLFLWRNDQTVVIGRGQNPWKECNTQKMEEDGITLARRSSGGGAVYHDLGNTNFTFMAGKPGYNKESSTALILAALRSLGIEAQSSGRNDIVLLQEGQPRKISGSAYRETKDRGFHHGTLLIDVDFGKLSRYLNPDPKKLQAKGISSVRSRVANLVEFNPTLNHEMICRAIETQFIEKFGEIEEIEYISEERPPNIPGFAAIYEKQRSWDWNFGQALHFSHMLDERFPWGGVEIHLDIPRGGRIEQAKIFTDSLFVEPFEQLATALVGVRYHGDEVEATLMTIEEQNPQFSEEWQQFSDWFIEAIR